jgi:hypothetical protein
MHLFSLRKIKTKLKSEGFTRKNGHWKPRLTNK